MLLTGRHDYKFSIAVGLNSKSTAGIFFTMLFYEKITVLPSKKYLHMERWPGYFLEIVACLPYLPLSLSHQVTSPMIQHGWRSVKHSLHPWRRGEPVRHHGNCSWPKVPPKFPLSTAAVFQTTIKSPGQHATTGKAHSVFHRQKALSSQPQFEWVQSFSSC